MPAVFCFEDDNSLCCCVLCHSLFPPMFHGKGVMGRDRRAMISFLKPPLGTSAPGTEPIAALAAAELLLLPKRKAQPATSLFQ